MKTPFEDGAVVKRIEHVRGFDIRQWDQDGGVMYDWQDDSGDESDELFESIEEAEADGRKGF